jgi:hypothetical protein
MKNITDIIGKKEVPGKIPVKEVPFTDLPDKEITEVPKEVPVKEEPVREVPEKEIPEELPEIDIPEK